MGRLRRIKDDEAIINNHSIFISKKDDIKLSAINKIEIGMGKGDFIISKSLQNDKITYFALDRYPTVILKAVQKIERLPLVPKNLFLMRTDALKLNEFFPPKTFETIYLNFSDPWPKKKHEKRRLTSPIFINIYKSLLTTKGIVKFKTDNDNLYNYSLETLTTNKQIRIIKKSRDLYKSKYFSNNVSTEYEKKFVKQGKKIKLIEFTFK